MLIFLQKGCPLADRFDAVGVLLWNADTFQLTADIAAIPK